MELDEEEPETDEPIGDEHNFGKKRFSINENTHGKN